MVSSYKSNNIQSPQQTKIRGMGVKVLTNTQLLQDSLFRLGLLNKSGNTKPDGTWDGVAGKRVKHGMSLYRQLHCKSDVILAQLKQQLISDVKLMDKIDPSEQSLISQLLTQKNPFSTYEIKNIQYALWKTGFMNDGELSHNLIRKNNIPTSAEDFDGIWLKGRGSTTRCLKQLFKSSKIQFDPTRIGPLLIKKILKSSSQQQKEPVKTMPPLAPPSIRPTMSQPMFAYDNRIELFQTNDISYASFSTPKGKDRLVDIIHHLLGIKTNVIRENKNQRVADCYGFVMCAKGVIDLNFLYNSAIPLKDRIRDTYSQAVARLSESPPIRKKDFTLRDEQTIPKGSIVCAKSYLNSGNTHWALKVNDNEYVDFTGSVNTLRPKTFFQAALKNSIRYLQLKQPDILLAMK